ncbi:MAG: hypothetical protein M3254_00230 [Actinomycetota bacterium]|jgi:hypothetical protein|nr:hypothetical protein [Actinomycetota bacterium]
MKAIRQEGEVVTLIDVIKVASESQQKLLEGMTRQAAVAKLVGAVR